jgi:hypothetical protein
MRQLAPAMAFGAFIVLLALGGPNLGTILLLIGSGGSTIAGLAQVFFAKQGKKQKAEAEASHDRESADNGYRL